MVEIPDPGGTPHSMYQCVKTSLKSVVRNDLIIEKLQDAALRSNRIMIHTLQFIELYFIRLYDKGLVLPLLDRKFVTSIMKLMCKHATRGRKPSDDTKAIKDKLIKFHEKHYKDSMVEELDYKNLSGVLNYMSTDIVTMYENNIKQHFVECVERFVNVIWAKKQLIAIIRKHKKTNKCRQLAINTLCNRLRKVKNDLLNPGKSKTSHPLYHDWIDIQREQMLPQREFKNDSVFYDLKCSPQDYLPAMLYMMKAVEDRGEKVYNVCPLRTEIIPKHFRLDTDSLINLCFTKEQGSRTDYKNDGNLVKRQDETWGFFFKTGMKCFHLSEDKHRYSFDHQIETDGVSCSILLKRRDLINKRVIESKVKKQISEIYIDEVQDHKILQDKNVVAIDPNLSDLLYCVNSAARDQVKFRYTQNTRRNETKVKKYRNYINKKKSKIIDGKTVGEWESKLSRYNKKTLDFDSFKVYIKKKNRINSILEPFYNRYIFRKLKLGSYMRRQITEARMLARFKKLFGPPAETIVAIGDFEQRKHRKYKEPVKGKGFRTLFRKAGYKVYLVDEFRTSCRCSFCEGECKTFRLCENPRPYRSGLILRHGLVKCKTCLRLWNRDVNAASNIWKIAMAAIKHEPRPTYLQRTRGPISGATSVPHDHDSQCFIQKVKNDSRKDL